MSPAVWPRPQYRSTNSPRSPPSSIVSRSLKVTSGQVSPGMDSLPVNSLGIRPCSDAQSAIPRSAMSTRVCSWATITCAWNAAAPSVRTAW